MNGDVIEVFGDLRAGDDVVRRGNDEIRPGTKITLTARISAPLPRPFSSRR